MKPLRLITSVAATLLLAASAFGQASSFTHVGLPSAPTNWDVSPDGKLAVAIFKPDQRNQSQPVAGPARIILVDLTKKAIIADRSIDAGIGVFALNNNNVFVSGESSNVVYQLSSKDLTETARVFSPGPAVSLCASSDQSLWIETVAPNPTYSHLTHYQLPGLSPTSGPALQPSDSIPSRGPNFAPVGQYWYRQGLLFDPDIQKLRMILAPSGLLQLANDNPNTTNPNLDPSRVPVGPWGVATWNGFLIRGDTPIGHTNGTASCVLPDIPAALTLGLETLESQAGGAPAASEYVLRVRDLATGDSVQRFVLVPPEQMPSASPTEIFPVLPRIISRPGVAIAQALNQFFIIPTKSLGDGKLSEPVNFPLTQSVFSLNSTGQTKIPFQATGGKAPLVYSLAAPASWADIDSKTGLLTIDTAQAANAATDKIVDEFTRGKRNTATQPSDIQRQLINFRESYAKRFQEILGKTATGIPVSVMARVVATDSEQMTATIQEGFLLDLPIEPVQQRILDLIAQGKFSSQPGAGNRTRMFGSGRTASPTPATRP